MGKTDNLHASKLAQTVHSRTSVSLNHIETHSLCMRGKTGTIRYIEAIHSQKKLSEMGSSIDYSPSAREI
ncbi:MAG: hypothetical protein IJR68_02595 [Fretibacterium sp.]|nr:hypothetical protein [Fretibacterium sp.]